MTNADLLTALADAGETGLTVVDLAARLGLPPVEAKWRITRLYRRGAVRPAGHRARRPGERGMPARVWLLAPTLDATPAPLTTLCV